MRTLLLACFVFTVSMALFADDYLVVFQSEKATAHDKIALRDALFTMLNDRTKITWSTLNQWATTNAPVVTGRVVVVNFDNLRKMTKTSTTDITVDKLNRWKTNNLDNPVRTQFDVGSSWMEIQLTNGMITVVSTNNLLVNKTTNQKETK